IIVREITNLSKKLQPYSAWRLSGTMFHTAPCNLNCGTSVMKTTNAVVLGAGIAASMGLRGRSVEFALSPMNSGMYLVLITLRDLTCSCTQTAQTMLLISCIGSKTSLIAMLRGWRRAIALCHE